MTDINSLQNEAESLDQKARGASEAAQQKRVKAAQHTAAGQMPQAEAQANAAMMDDKKAADYSADAQQKRAEIADLQQKAQVIERELHDNQQQLRRIKGA